VFVSCSLHVSNVNDLNLSYCQALSAQGSYFFCFPVRCADVLRFGLGFCGSARPAGCLTASLKRARLDHRIGMGTVRWATVEGCGPPRSEAPESHEFRESPAAPSQSELFAAAELSWSGASARTRGWQLAPHQTMDTLYQFFLTDGFQFRIFFHLFSVFIFPRAGPSTSLLS
jgi:hypothetical protein